MASPPGFGQPSHVATVALHPPERPERQAAVCPQCSWGLGERDQACPRCGSPATARSARARQRGQAWRAGRGPTEPEAAPDPTAELWDRVSGWLAHLAGAQPEWREHNCRLLTAIARARSDDADKAFRLARHFSLYREGMGWPLRLRAADCRPGLEAGVCVALPGRDREGRGLVMVSGRRLDLRARPVEAYIKAAHYVFEQLVLPSRAMQESGLSVLLDLKDTAAGEALALQGVIKTMQDTFPCKIKRVCVVRAGMLMRFALSTIISSLKPKLQERVVIMPKLAELHELVPLECLPAGLGGSHTDAWQDWVQARVVSEITRLDTSSEPQTID